MVKFFWKKKKKKNELQTELDHRQKTINNVYLWFDTTMIKHPYLLYHIHELNMYNIQQKYFDTIKRKLLYLEKYDIDLINLIKQTSTVIYPQINEFSYVLFEKMFDDTTSFLRKRISNRLVIDTDTIKHIFNKTYPKVMFKPNQIDNCTIWTDDMLITIWLKLKQM
jgi:hypothetical protein